MFLLGLWTAESPAKASPHGSTRQLQGPGAPEVGTDCKWFHMASPHESLRSPKDPCSLGRKGESVWPVYASPHGLYEVA